MSSPSNLHSAWAELLVGALASAGICDLIVSPGSRSTPLVLAAAKEPRLTCRVIVDERSAAFFALGQARASGVASALLCTSGTAAAHYFPAIIEAAASFVPLLVVSADRPWEDRATGAPQTIDQVKMFGEYVRHFADLGPPDASAAAFRAVQRIAAQCVFATSSPTPGPVQLNAQFRKPLEPVVVADAESWRPLLDSVRSRKPTRIFPPLAGVDSAALELAFGAIKRAERGLIVCGPSTEPADFERNSLLALARVTGFPILAECTSQQRFGGLLEGVTHAAGFDVYFRDAAFRRRHVADLILELGAPPTSAGYATYLAEHQAERIVVAPHGHPDPRGDATALVHASPARFAEALVEKVEALGRALKNGSWSEAFARADAETWKRAEQESRETRLSEASIARIVVHALPEGATLVVGNSNPVRDLDTFVPPTLRDVRVVHQRGAAGIDGLVSGAAGFASLAKSPTVLYVGDLTFLHDLGGLAAVKHVGTPLVIVVVQNDGGRIFEELPIHAASSSDPTFETFFATSQKVDFSAAAAAFGIAFHRVETTADLSRVVAAGIERAGCTVIEAIVPAHDGSIRRAQFRKDVARLIAALPAEPSS
ncbi:MAG: 2-succinyl-5-enolpyruvyl-6-hydroxy-3-cyclohexene-1-carboxylic-acid synthase [Polyangiaceae bacterium]